MKNFVVNDDERCDECGSWELVVNDNNTMYCCVECGYSTPIGRGVRVKKQKRETLKFRESNDDGFN